MIFEFTLDPSNISYQEYRNNENIIRNNVEKNK